MTVKETVQAIFKCLNSGRFQFTEELGTELLRQHPTLQQNFVRCVVNVLKTYASNVGYIDGRNRAAAEFAEMLKKMMDKEEIESLFPFI